MQFRFQLLKGPFDNVGSSSKSNYNSCVISHREIMPILEYQTATSQVSAQGTLDPMANGRTFSEMPMLKTIDEGQAPARIGDCRFPLALDLLS